MCRPERGSPQHVVVIGAGIVGAATAIELLRAGHEVTILEPGPIGGEHAASYGNGGWLSSSLVVPTSMPGLWRHVAGYLADPLGPFTIRWRYLPRLLPWLWSFLQAGATAAPVEKTAAAIAGLIYDCRERHRELAREAGVSDLLQDASLIHVLRKESDFDADALPWRLRRENGRSGVY